MCVKFLFGDLNFDPYPPHLISTNTCRVTIVSKMYSDKNIFLTNHLFNYFSFYSLDFSFSDFCRIQPI